MLKLGLYFLSRVGRQLLLRVFLPWLGEMRGNVKRWIDFLNEKMFALLLVGVELLRDLLRS
jgi:hypothetical protein